MLEVVTMQRQRCVSNTDFSFETNLVTLMTAYRSSNYHSVTVSNYTRTKKLILSVMTVFSGINTTIRKMNWSNVKLICRSCKK